MVITRTITLPDLMSIRLQIKSLAEARLTGGLFISSCFWRRLLVHACLFLFFFFASISSFLDTYTASFFLSRIMSAMYGIGCGSGFSWICHDV
jgi:hypothetical protein